MDQRYSSDVSNRERDIPSFIEPRPPLILNPFMRPRPQKGTNLLELFEEDDSLEEEAPELVQVYLRLKPSNVPSNLYEVRGDQCLITSVDTATAGHGRRTQQNVPKMYTFSHIFGPETHQKEIFDHVVKNNLRKLPCGNSFTLITYGASGSGKTYTLMGTVQAPGLVPRSLEYVFKVVEAAQKPLYRPGDVRANKLSVAEQEHELQWVRQLRHLSAPLRDKYRRMSTRLCGDMTRSTVDLTNRTKHYVWVSFVEIYNEAIYDLLVTTDRTAASKLRIREDPSGNVYVKGATQAFVRTGEEAYDVLVAGKHNLQVHATGVHARSSRSHSIFTITMLTETEAGIRSAHVRLCDLAGTERAHRTRNTGARMQESRAINSSLHVLERCLYTLRRKQASKQDLVPYRESKLTRLLGPGLSGTRGEAVSIVVTLNPAPEYAHETRHVLQLAVVARDIQVNNTIAESVSTLESSCSQDTTIASGAEVTRLRADNERLHYELVQAEALNRKLMEKMTVQQQENAVTVKELVDEARDITHQYYKQQIRSLEERREAEIADLREEYEAKLAETVIADEGTRSRALQTKVTQLMKQIAILEEELNAERLARERMNEEMLHLRACIEERDEKAAVENSNEEDAIQLTDSEDESEEADDLCNDSLEPTFKKADINRSRLMRQSSMFNNTRNTTFDNMDNPLGTLKDDSMTDRDMTDDEESKRDSTVTEPTDATYDVSSNDTIDQSMDCPATVKKADVKKDSEPVNEIKLDNFDNSNVECKHSVRETYFVSNSNESLSGNAEKRNSIDNETGNFADVSGSLKEDDDLKDFSIIDDKNVPKFVKPIETQIDKIKRFAKSTVSTDSSLAQFEMLELEVNDLNKDEKAFKYFDYDTEKGLSISMSPRKKEKKTYFDDKQPSPNQISIVQDLIKKHDLLRSPSIVQDEIPENYKPTTISKIMRESFTVSIEVPPALFKNKVLLKLHDSIDPFEDVDSPRPDKPDVLKGVEEGVSLDNTEKEVKSAVEVKMIGEEVRKSIGKVSLDNTEKEVKSAEEVKMIGEEVRKSIGKVSLDNTEKEVKSAEEVKMIGEEVRKSIGKVSLDNTEKEVKSAEEVKMIGEEVRKSIGKVSLDNTEKEVKSAEEVKMIGEEVRKSIGKVYLDNTEKEVKSAEEVKMIGEEVRKSIGKVSLVNTEKEVKSQVVENEIKSENVIEIIEKEGNAEIEVVDAEALSKEDKNTVNINLDVPSPPKRNKSTVQSKSETSEKVTNISVKLDILTDAKQEQTSSETVDKNTVEQLKADEFSHDMSSLNGVTNSNQTIAPDNTIDAFENIYKDITAPRATDFEFLVSDKTIDTANEILSNKIDGSKEKNNINEGNGIQKVKSTENYKKTQKDIDVDGDNNNHEIKHDNESKEVPESNKIPIKYNLRHKTQDTSKTDNVNEITEATEKCAPRTAKKSLRLRKRNKVDEQVEEEVKLKDIVNLQKEFSDVTMGVPALVKVVADMPSPEKDETENLPPMMGVQSCPSQSVTRSRRKLFTPRAEPLYESPPAGDSGERVRVPRPSYHRTRTRRRL